jgi:hypothetical protein
MSLIKANAVQVGQSPTATQNFTLAVPSSPDGTIKLARGNAGATTQDVITVDALGNVSFAGTIPSGNISSSTAIATDSTTARSLANRFADVVNVKDFGAVGNGSANDTVAIQSAIALASGKSIYFPNGIYVFNGVISSLFDIPLFGGGTIRINGYDYPVQREQALNQLWAGEARCWPMGNALECSAVQRTHIPAGASISRTVFADEVTLYHVNGDYSEDAIRIQRNATTSNISSAVLVFSLTQDESQTLSGKDVVLQWNGSKSSTYTGGNITYKIQWSEEPQQPIINADGTYTNGNIWNGCFRNNCSQ